MPSHNVRAALVRSAAACVLGMCHVFGVAASVAADPLAVEVINQSERVLCAEKDNVAVAFRSPSVRRFRIEAAHPAYLNALERDSFAADWTDCDMSGDPIFRSNVTAPTRTTLYERPDLWLVGWTFPTFWRPSTAVVTVGEKRFEGLHLVQLWTIRPMGGEEILVFYPQDGYWRLRPKAPAGRDLTAFGSSFLVGPVTDAGRPVVEWNAIAFDPDATSFDVTFKAGGSARVAVSEMSDQRAVLDVTFDRPITDAPFAMVRSMYVTDFNNDAARIAIKPAAGPGDAPRGWLEAPILDFKTGRATDVWVGRTAISRHNSSSPDMVLRAFASQAR